MTKKTETDKLTAAANDYVANVTKTFQDFQKQAEVPAAVRDLMKNSAEAAKVRAGEFQSGAYQLADGTEQFLNGFVDGYAKLTRGVVDAAFSNIEHALDTVEKIAAANTVNEAVQLQADFLRDNARANYDRANVAAENVRTAMADNARRIQDEFAKYYGKKAA